ncbi:MAG: site-2 protease family protein [Gemmatimonadota bacterium]
MEELTAHFAAWRILHAGNREITDAVVAPEHRGPSAGLEAALGEWPGAFYWASQDRSSLILIRPVGPARRERWVFHLCLFVITALCSLGAGAALAGQFRPAEEPGLQGALLAALRFMMDPVHGSWASALSGWTFTAPLLAILLIHELGHYFAARRYLIDASPPYFMPIPPSLSPIGSLGAFIRLRSPVLDRLQLLDVGAAGPLAGFVVALGVLVWGYASSSAVPAGWQPHASFVEFAGNPIFLGESFLTQALRDHFLPGAEAVRLSLPAFAGWVGMFITGLNLLPLSQLDGGHVLYGLIGKKQIAVSALAVVGLIYLAQTWWGWYLWAGLTLIVGKGRWSHPSVLTPGRSIPSGHRVVGWLCVLIFVLTFVPIPFLQQ